ncbi:MAG: 50S ribosomal protein L25/general stress protein Ctc [Gammaproteobacteria bacterium]|nr:50S ribosomal protein L25/general stress protein Ctc [Gammaproteobacteria bacterium]
MSKSFELIAESRDDKGRGASRRLRREGKVPAVLYGGKRDPRPIALDHQALLHQLDNEAFYSSVLTIKVGDEEQAAILKDLQRHPARHRVLHADLQRILADEKIRMHVPLHFIGESEAPGVKLEHGVFSKMESDVEVSCLPKHLPGYLEIDCSGMGMEDIRHLSDIKLPEGVELVELAHGEGNDLPIAAVHHPRVEAVEEEEAAGAAEAAGAEEGEGEKPDEEKSRDED